MKKLSLILFSLVIFLFNFIVAHSYNSSPKLFITELVSEAVDTLSNKKISKEEKAIFVVTKLKADYLRPAYFDDILTLESEIEVVSYVRAYFHQNIFCKGEVIFRAEVCVACTSTSGKVQRLPEKIKILMT